MKKFLRSTYYVFVVVVFLLIAAIGLTQTRTFRTYVQTLLVAQLETLVDADIEMGSLEGNLGTGFHIERVAVRKGGHEIFYAERLEARYDPLGFLVQRASVSRLTLLRPRIHLWRTVEKQWNVDQILKPKEESDTTSSSWVLNFGQIEMLGATVSIVDSFALTTRTAEEWERMPAGAIDYSDVNLSPLTLRAAIKIQGKQTEIDLHSLDFESARPRFTLNQLSGEFLLSPRTTEIRNLTIRIPGTSLKLDARLDEANPLAIKQLRELAKAPTTLALSVDKLEFATLQRFLPGPVDFLANEASLDVKATGTFGHLRIDEVQVRTPRTFIRIAGTIDNLHNPRNLALDLHAEDNILHPADAMELVPGLNLPDLRSIGVLSCNYTFKGRPDHFEASIAGNVEAGHFETKATLDLRPQSMIYDATIATNGFNLGALYQTQTLESSLNATGTLSGSGTKLQDLTAILRLQVDSSSFIGMPVNNSVVVMDISDRTLRSNLLLHAGLTRVDLNARTSFRNDDSTHYSLNGKIFSLNLADVLRNTSYESDLSFDIKSEGTAFQLNPAQARTDIRFLRSTFAEETFENTDIVADYRGEDTLRQTLTLTSEPIDITVDGRFAVSALVESFKQTGTILSEALKHRFATLDSIRSATKPERRETFRLRTSPIPALLNAQVSVNVKDSYPLGIFLGLPMRGTSVLRAEVSGSPDGLRLNGDLDISQFAIRSSKTNLGIIRGKSSFRIDKLRNTRTLEALQSNLTFAADGLLIDSLGLSQVNFTHDLRNDSSSYAVSGIIDSTVRIDVEGTSAFVPNLIRLNLSKLHVKFADYAFENADRIDLVYGSDGIQLNALTLQHEAEVVTASGILDPTGISDLKFSVGNFLIRNLKDFSRKESFVSKVKDFNGVLDANGSFSGNFNIPKFDLTLLARGVTVASAVFGQVSGSGSYADGLSNIFLEFRSKPQERNSRPELLVSGRMPLKLGSVSPARSAQGMDMTIQSRGFRLEFLDPFVPVTRNLTGELHADLKMRGTLSEPSYEGSLSVKDARFLFTPVGIVYDLNGVLIPKGRAITFQGLTLSNIEDDRVTGLIDGLGSMGIEGGFTLEGLEIRKFDLAASGQLLIMKESYRLQSLPLYGNVYIASGTSPLRWAGTPDRSTITGDLLVKNANITFPPSNEVVFEKTRLFSVNYVDDTTTTTQTRPRASRTRLNGNGNDLMQLAGPATDDRSTPQEEKSFLDNIDYNLTVEASGLTQIRFVFNQLTNEELSADLKGRLVFTKDPSASRLTGELQVGSRSYYKYFKTLQATGKLLFTGEPTNPELDIAATYEGTYQPDTTRIGMTEQDKQEQKVVVRLTITGTRQEPKVKMGLEVYDRDGNKKEQRPDAQSDAIAFLVSGRFKEEMTQPQQTSLTTNLLSSIGSSLLSGPLTDFVRSQIGYITSIDVVYYGGVNKSFQESADVRITGEVGDAVIRLGGRVFSDISNANVSVQFPMSSVVGSEAWRNLILELERRVEGVESIEQRRPSNGLRLLYRITF